MLSRSGKSEKIDTPQDWVIREFQHVDFGDDRLFDRFLVTAQLLTNHPGRSIHQACGDRAASKGAYRLFGNSKVEFSEIFASHQIETSRRAVGKKQVFSIQDTTFLDWDTHEKTEGLGSISKGYGKRDKRGLVLHPALLIDEEGTPLGLSGFQCWPRPFREAGRTRSQKSAENYRRPTKEKESQKWLTAFRQTSESLPEDVRVITIADREADMFELMREIQSQSHGFVIRSRINRRITQNKYRAPVKLWEFVGSLPVEKTVYLEIPSQRGRSARKAQIELRFTPASTPMREGLRHKDKLLSREISFFVIEAKEINPPSKEEAIHWILLTSEPITTGEEAYEKIRWYRLRWQIEVFFRILKSGCGVESCRLGQGEKLIKYVVLMTIAAFRIFYLDRVARRDPEQPCTSILRPEEWKALYCRKHRTREPPKREPGTREVLHWIAELGGYLNRNSDGPPGPMVLWRGWQILQDITALWTALHPDDSAIPP